MASENPTRWAYVIGAIVGAALLGLAVFAVLAGLEVADQLSSVLSLAVAVTTAGATIAMSRRGPTQPSRTPSSTTFNVYRNKKVNIYPPES